MTVQELIDKLSYVKDRSLPVNLYVCGREGESHSVNEIENDDESSPDFGKILWITIFSY